MTGPDVKIERSIQANLPQVETLKKRGRVRDAGAGELLKGFWKMETPMRAAGPAAENLGHASALPESTASLISS
jgi:hypothetical protein